MRHLHDVKSYTLHRPTHANVCVLATEVHMVNWWDGLLDSALRPAAVSWLSAAQPCFHDFSVASPELCKASLRPDNKIFVFLRSSYQGNKRKRKLF